jgi:predicted dehydrogenase
MPLTSRTLPRRRLLRTAAAALAAPWVTSGLRAASPNGKLRHAAFGASGMSWSDITSMANHPKFELAAVCDVDTSKFDAVKKRFPEVRCYQDWREMLAQEGDRIDSVNVSTPDHMHGPQGLASIALGKHVYGQKPLAHNLWECRQLMLRARERKVMTQMGIQISSAFSERLAVALIQEGAIGKVRVVHTYSNKKWGDMAPVPNREDPVPPSLNWDQWLGPAETRPFIAGYYHPGNWRRRIDFGTGTLGDMGCHMFSGWFRALDLAAPISVKSTGTPNPNATNWAVNGRVEYTFAGTRFTEKDKVTVIWTDGDHKPPAEIVEQLRLSPDKKPSVDQGTLYVGTEGLLYASHGATPQLFPRDKFSGYKYPKLEPRDHWKDFIDCCLEGNRQPSANFDYAGPLTEAVLLGCLSSHFPNQDLVWDSPGLRIPNSDAANALVRRRYRAGWEVV